MKKYKYLFFDLDGTLTDSAKGIISSLKYVFSKCNIDCSNIDLKRYVGPPLKASFAESISQDEDVINRAIEYYREDYGPNRMISENEVYDGVADMLEKLQEVGYTLYIVTSKPEPSVVRILEHFKLAQYFTGVFGALLDGSRDEKYDVLNYALQQTNCKLEDCVMIGDRMYDMAAAQKAGIDAIGVLYGYGGIEELSAYKNVFLAKNADELKAFLMS